jgi:hypothetical protein
VGKRRRVLLGIVAALWLLLAVLWAATFISAAQPAPRSTATEHQLDEENLRPGSQSAENNGWGYSCTALPGYDQIQWHGTLPANAYAQLAGVTAALTVTALVVVLQSSAASTDDSAGGDAGGRQEVIMLGTITVVSTMLASFLYSQVAGNDQCGQYQTMVTAIGVVMGIGIISLILTLTWVAYYTGTRGIALRFLQGASTLICALAFAFAWVSGSTALLYFRKESALNTTHGLAAAAVVIVLLGAHHVLHMGRSTPTPEESVRIREILTLAGVALLACVLTTALCIWAGWVNVQAAPAKFWTPSATTPVLAMAILAVLAVRCLPPDESPTSRAGGSKNTPEPPEADTRNPLVQVSVTFNRRQR